MKIAAGQFKTKCLQLMDQVQQTREEVVITKRGKPLAKLVPVLEAEFDTIVGYLPGSVQVVGNIVSPVDERWEADL